jgi:hypothetical protein
VTRSSRHVSENHLDIHLSPQRRQMKSVTWKDIAELLGMTAIVASLIFVGMQLSQERDIARRESRTDFVASTVEIARLFSDNRTEWVKGLRGDSLTENEQVTFNALVRVFYVERYNRYERRKLNFNRGLMPEEVPRFVALYMYQYPGLRQGVTAQMTKTQTMRKAAGIQRTSEFWAKIQISLDEYDKSQPELPPADFIVF